MEIDNFLPGSASLIDMIDRKQNVIRPTTSAPPRWKDAGGVPAILRSIRQFGSQ
jgi:hypothetical protein